MISEQCYNNDCIDCIEGNCDCECHTNEEKNINFSREQIKFLNQENVEIKYRGITMNCKHKELIPVFLNGGILGHQCKQCKQKFEDVYQGD